jgi:hypothetical protein
MFLLSTKSIGTILSLAHSSLSFSIMLGGELGDEISLFALFLSIQASQWPRDDCDILPCPLAPLCLCDLLPIPDPEHFTALTYAPCLCAQRHFEQSLCGPRRPFVFYLAHNACTISLLQGQSLTIRAPTDNVRE